MIRRLLIFFLLPCALLAQPKHYSTINAALDRDPYRFKGIRLGMPLSELNALIGSSHWAYARTNKKPAKAASMYGDGTGQLRIQADERVGPNSDFMYLDRSIAGRDTTLNGHIEYAVVYLIHGKVFQVIAYSEKFAAGEAAEMQRWLEHVRSSVAEAHGPPKREHQSDMSFFLIHPPSDGAFTYSEWWGESQFRLRTEKPARQQISVDVVFETDSMGDIMFARGRIVMHDDALGNQYLQDASRRQTLDPLVRPG